MCAYLTKNLGTMATKLNSKKTKVQFSSHTINVAMSLLLRGKKSYDDLRDLGLLCLPQPSALKIITKNLKVLPGGDSSIYLTLKDEIEKLAGEVLGHIMMDEIKLNNGIAYNCNSNEVTGFVESQLNTKKIFENILSMNKKPVGNS